MKKLIGYPKMFEEAKQSKRKGHVWIVELLIFFLVFLVASTAESIPLSLASTFGYLYKNLPQLMEILETEGFIAYYMAVLSGVMDYIASGSWTELLSLFSTAAATVVIILYCTKIEKRSLASMGFRKRNFFLEYLGGAAAGIASISLAAVIGILSGAYHFTLAQPKAWWLLLFLLGFILQGMSEEVMCRGYLMNSMSRRTPVIVCVILTSLVFALLHFANPGFGWLPFVNLLLSGFTFAFYMIKRGNIWGACAMHTFWNFYQGPIFGISVSGTGSNQYAVFRAVTDASENMELWTGGTFGIEGGLCVTIAEVLTLLFVLFLLPKNKEEQFVPVRAEGPAPSDGAVFGNTVSAAPVQPAAPAEIPVSAEPVPASEVRVFTPEPAVGSNVTVLDFNVPKPQEAPAMAPAEETPAAEIPAEAIPAAVTPAVTAPVIAGPAAETPVIPASAASPVIITEDPAIDARMADVSAIRESVTETPAAVTPEIKEAVITEETIVMGQEPSQNV